MDQAEPENQIFYRHQQECSDDADLDCVMRLSAPGISQVSVETQEMHAANITITTAQFV